MVREVWEQRTSSGRSNDVLLAFEKESGMEKEEQEEVQMQDQWKS